MTTASQKIRFEVETERVLEILAKEIYDSPSALLRENVQNAYDACLMRHERDGLPLAEIPIEIEVSGTSLSVRDRGIGMTEEVLRNHFWKAGSSGKRNELAQRSGVVGTFGIGAMANFGVCTELTVRTATAADGQTIVSTARRNELSIAEECISLTTEAGSSGPGTTISVALEPAFALAPEAALEYLRPYVRYLRVPVLLNGDLISQEDFEHSWPHGPTEELPLQAASFGASAAQVVVRVAENGQVRVRLSDIQVNGQHVSGELDLTQRSGPLFGYRNRFGLAPTAAPGHYGFGGIANLWFLVPTAGREALSRESVRQLNELVQLAEEATSEALSKTPAADKNRDFLNYVVGTRRFDLCDNVSVRIRPDDIDVPLSDLPALVEARTNAHFYLGHDPTLIAQFSPEGGLLACAAQNNPRRKIQHVRLRSLSGIAEVPNAVTVVKVFQAAELSVAEAALLARILLTLQDDYLLSDIEIALADISHGVEVQFQETPKPRLLLSRSSSAIKQVTACYETAYDVFPQFTKDFVRQHIYKSVEALVPSSTKQGVDALMRTLRRNRELYRYEESEQGEIESLLTDYLAGDTNLEQVIRGARRAGRSQVQKVLRNQVTTMEEAMPNIIASPTQPDQASAGEARPPIVREEAEAQYKLIVTDAAHATLNSFRMFLGVSERLFRREGDFLRQPHSTRLVWAAHRILYVFTYPTGSSSLYYDIQLRAPVGPSDANGKVLKTTTIITANRIFIPVPPELESAFRIGDEGYNEFLVRFDVL